MFRTKEEILKELERDFKKYPISRDVSAVLSKQITLKNSGEIIQYALEDLAQAAVDIKPSDDVLRLASHTTKECAQRLIEQEQTALAIKYRCMIADVLSKYRTNKKCMDFVIACYAWALKEMGKNHYLKNDLPKYFEVIAYENLALIYSDEKCVAYNLDEAFVNFVMFDSLVSVSDYFDYVDNADLMYGFAKAILSQKGKGLAQKYNALDWLKDAARCGHKKAEEELKNIRRSQNVCVYCGERFKGIFIKKCAKCGKKKDY